MEFTTENLAENDCTNVNKPQKVICQKRDHNSA